MAVIPQYSAEGPAQSRAPVLESGQSVRLDPRGVLSSLDGLAQSLSGAAVQNPTIPGNLGQGRAQGTGALGRGVAQLANLFQSLEMEKAEARNYADEAEASQAMARMAGDFAEWRERNPDSSRWESELSSRLDDFRGRYYEGKEISPVARERIESNFDRFVTDLTVDTKLSAVKAEVGRAKRAAKANWDLAVHNQDLEGARAISAKMIDRQWIHPDEAALMDIEAEEKIRERQISEALDYADAFAMQGDASSAKIQLDSIRGVMDPGEFAKKEAEFETKVKVGISAVNFKNRYYSGENANDLRAELEERNEDGSYKNHPELTPAVRAELLKPIFADINRENVATVEGFKKSIDDGVSLRHLETSEAFKSLPDAAKRDLAEYAVAGARNDVSEFAKTLRDVRGYDPSTDPRGEEFANFQQGIALRFSGERSAQLMAALEEASNRPQSAPERVLSDYFSDLQSRYDAGELGNFRITGDQISLRKDKDGVEIFTVPDPNGDFIDPGLLGTYRGRTIELSEQDKLRFKEKGRDSGQVFEDRKAKELAFSKFLRVQEELERRVKERELTSADEIEAAGNALLGGEIEEAWRNRSDSDGGGTEMPRHSFGRPSNPSIPSSADYEAKIDEIIRKWDQGKTP